MAEVNVNAGADALVKRIIAEAEADAEGILAANREQTSAVSARGDKRADAVLKDGAAAAQKKRADAVERGRTGGELHVRKTTLAERRAMLGRAFDEAYTKLCALSGAERDGLIARALVREADGGEEILPAACERDGVKRILAAVNGELAQSGRAPLTLADSDSDGENGFVLKAAGYEKNCSLRAMLEDARTREETAVFGILFGAGGK